MLNENAVLATNDLGPLGSAYNRSSVTTDGTSIYARTIREALCFRETSSITPSFGLAGLRFSADSGYA